MKKEDIHKLISQCLAFFQESNYTPNRIGVYKTLWKHGIVQYMEAKSLTFYTPEIGAEFTTTCHHNGTVRPQEREKIRSIQVLDDMLILGHIRKRCFTPVYHRLDGELGLEMEKLVTHMTNLRRSATTIRDYRLYLSEFLQHLGNAGVHHLCEIAEHHIISFILAHPTNKVNIVSALRVLFRFWKEEHILVKDFSKFFETFRVRKTERLPSFYTTNEVIQVEQSISRSSRVGKRNYAMVLLASRLGLRASDIAKLQFGDIDWDDNNITIKMQKTRRINQLPLLAQVGNAIVDYLKNGRPASSLKSVFLSGRAPYVGATKGCVCAAINTIITNSGVDVNLKHHGPHSLRHSLASAMMQEGASLPAISEALGHKHTDTTMIYLKINTQSLLKCALPVSMVLDGFYSQRGGAFYV
jgi:site-specific recombinase XerD